MVDIDQIIHYYKSKVAQKEKNLFGFSYSKNMAKFWSVSVDNFI